MTNQSTSVETPSVKTKLRKAFNRLMSDPNHSPYIKRFCEALIDYQLYRALNKHDQYNNEDQALSDEEILSGMRSTYSLDDLDPSEEGESINSGADLSIVRKKIGLPVSPIFLPY